MPIEELLALYNCVSPAVPMAASTTGSTTRRLSSRSRGVRRASRRTPSKDASEPVDGAMQKENISANQTKEKDVKLAGDSVSLPKVEPDTKIVEEKKKVVDELLEQKNADEVISGISDKVEETPASDDDDEVEEESDLRKLYPETYKNKDQRLLRGESIRELRLHIQTYNCYH